MSRIFQIQAQSYFICVSLLFLLMSCSHSSQKHEETRDWTIPLLDSIGLVHIKLPLVYDTLHSWICSSDYSGGDLNYYRIQSSNSRLVEEGCFMRNVSDTFYSLTVSHSFQPELRPDEPFNPHELLRRQLEYERYYFPKLDQDFDTASFNINGLYYSYIYQNRRTSSGKKLNNEIYINTVFNHRRIQLTFEKTSDSIKDNAFIEESIEALKTIRFEKYRR